MLRFRLVLLQFSVFLALPISGWAQDVTLSPKNVPDQVTGQEEPSDPVLEKDIERSKAETERSASSAGTADERRVEMLERLGDQISSRMRSLKEREQVMAAREKAMVEREASVEQREKTLGSLEELMQLREDVVNRREKLPPPQSWNGPEAPTIYGQYAAVVDGTNLQFYHKKGAHSKVPVASTQKLVTSLLVCFEGNLDRMVVVPPEVLDVEPTVIGVKPGETYTRRQLLTSLLVRSGNDIAATLAIDNAGSIEAFAEKMNAFAKTIGMNESNFVNPHGLPAEGQYSTARDIAVAAFEAYQIPDIREITRKLTYDFVFNDGSVRTLYNTNKVLGSFEGCNGMKTGFTYAAGNCLVTSCHVGGKDRISVVLKSARAYVSEDSKKLLQWSLDLELAGPIGMKSGGLAAVH